MATAAANEGAREDAISSDSETQIAPRLWTAILLAGQRPDGDPLAEFCGQKYKALIPVAGTSMLLRVAKALLGSKKIGRIVILAQEPEELIIGDTAQLNDDPRICFAQSNDGIATSIAAVAGTTIAPWPLLVTTADHALLTVEMIEELLADAAERDISIGVGERSNIENLYPMTRRTWLKFSDGHFSGANLFALRDGKAMAALDLWSTVERDRKKSWKIISRFGPYLLLRALTRTITFQDAIRKAGNRLGLNAGPVVLSQPEAAIDVDKPSDLELAETILSNVFRSGAVKPVKKNCEPSALAAKTSLSRR